MLILYLSLREGQIYNVVIIAKRIHLFPYRTQKLSSLAAMVLGGRPPGRVARSHVVCRSGGTGRARTRPAIKCKQKAKAAEPSPFSYIDARQKAARNRGLLFSCRHSLFSRPVTRQVFSAIVSLTSVFGMGTGGPSRQSTPTIELRCALKTEHHVKVKDERGKKRACILYKL